MINSEVKWEVLTNITFANDEGFVTTGVYLPVSLTVSNISIKRHIDGI